MQVLVSADSGVRAHPDVITRVETEVGTALSRFGAQVSRVEVHLSDEAAGKSDAADKRCVLVARAGQQRVVVTHHAASLEEACRAGARRLRTLLERKLDRLDDHKGSETIRQPR